MTRCYQCQGISSYDTEPCPNDPPCKPQSICNFPVTRCEHKEAARITKLGQEAWAHVKDSLGRERTGLDWMDWEDLPDRIQDYILRDAERVYMDGYRSGFDDGKTERR